MNRKAPLQRLRNYVGPTVVMSLICCLCLLCVVGLTEADQPEKPGEPVDWDLLPNGLLVVQYDSTGDGVPDSVALHQVVWSGWTAQPILEIEAQARQDDRWAFIVDYEWDRFVYFGARTPLFAGNDPLAQVPFLTKEP